MQRRGLDDGGEAETAPVLGVGATALLRERRRGGLLLARLGPELAPVPLRRRVCEVVGTVAATRDGASVRFYGEAPYRAGTWSRERRVVFKAEVLVAEGKVDKDNPRFVVTNVAVRVRAQTVYEDDYCRRGDSENRIRELKHGLAIDRTSCQSFRANQFRVLMTAAAYLLFQEIRTQLAGTEAASWQMTTLRERLLKIGVRVVESVRRCVLHFSAAHPWRELWCRAALRLGAAAG